MCSEAVAGTGDAIEAPCSKDVSTLTGLDRRGPRFLAILVYKQSMLEMRQLAHCSCESHLTFRSRQLSHALLETDEREAMWSVYAGGQILEDKE